MRSARPVAYAGSRGSRECGGGGFDRPLGGAPAAPAAAAMTESIAEQVDITSFADRYFDQNCLVIRRRDTKSALVIDPGLQVEQVSDFIDKQALQVDHILLTHGHVDHVFGVPVIKEQTGAPTYMHPMDLVQLERNPTVIIQFGLDPDQFGKPIIDHELSEGTAVGWEDLLFDVIHTPGHTQGSVVFLFGQRCFGGDTLFRRAVPRTPPPRAHSHPPATSIPRTPLR